MGFTLSRHVQVFFAGTLLGICIGYAPNGVYNFVPLFFGFFGFFGVLVGAAGSDLERGFDLRSLQSWQPQDKTSASTARLNGVDGRLASSLQNLGNQPTFEERQSGKIFLCLPGLLAQKLATSLSASPVGCH